MEPKSRPDKTLWLLGLVMTLPMILLSGPLAGFLIGKWILVDQFKISFIAVPILMVLGLIGSGLQAFYLIKRVKNSIEK